MKIDTLIIKAKYLAYWAHIARANAYHVDRDYATIRAMASAHTLSYFGRANYNHVSRVLKEIFKEYETRSAKA